MKHAAAKDSIDIFDLTDEDMLNKYWSKINER